MTTAGRVAGLDACPEACCGWAGRLDLCWLGRFCRLWYGHDFGQQLCCELVQTIGIVEEFSEC